MTTTHWQEWHRAYDDPGSALSRRLVLVGEELAASLDDAAAGPLRVLSLCSGDGRDVLGVLPSHPRGRDVSAVLVDTDAALLDRAASRATELGLASVRTVHGDAGVVATYEDALPADVLVACGIFGNVSDDDVRATISAFPTMVREGGHVLWTRHRRPPDLTVAIRSWFAEAGMLERRFATVEGTSACVGHHVVATSPHRAPPPRLFRFVGDGDAAHG